jgi:hypothetical protein
MSKNFEHKLRTKSTSDIYQNKRLYHGIPTTTIRQSGQRYIGMKLAATNIVFADFSNKKILTTVAQEY